MLVTELLLNGWADFDEIFCVYLSWSLDGLDLQLTYIGTMGVAPPIRSKNLLLHIWSTIIVGVFKLCVRYFDNNVHNLAKRGRDPSNGRGTSHTK